ncbi:hypothetical protein SEVIR_8G240200v4 [Setaria viridis]|uniref:Uncharacterized protein n=1 Tax=Setaria viridis TaxID=4556 RepID=A0A4V6D3G0_SETVI|nr:uncharacterized protein LOC117866775 [Setaria viridis]TKW02386.1 hypothetical protein SEVIR_8G240200v2 [Setaria viridis]
MAAGDTATIFLETTLGTRLVVSFPARATTVADLKRRVSAEHAACFPRTGPIAVTSLQVKLDGSWFQLTDSMAVRAAFEWVKGPWRLLAEAHELGSHPLARKDAKCGTGDAEQNAGHPVIAENSLQYMLPPALSQGGGSGSLASGDGVSDTPQVNQQDKPQEGVEHALGQRKDGIIMPEERSDVDLAAGDSDTPLPNQEDKAQECVEDASGQLEGGITMPQESSDFGLAAGDSDTPLPNQEDKPEECIEDASGQLDDGITMPQESADFGLAAGDSDAPPTNQQDKSHEGVEHASGQSEERTTMLQESSDLGVAADKVQISAEPRGKKRFREEDKISESIIVNCGDDLSNLASSTLNAELPGPKGSTLNARSTLTDQAKLNSVPLPYNLEDNSHGLGEKPSGGQKEIQTSGVHNVESSNNESDIPPRVESMERDESSDKEAKTQRGDKEEPRIAVRAGESSCKRTDVSHFVESMKEDIKRPASNSHYLDKGKSDGATSTVSQEHGPCFRRSHQRVVVRKVPISRAMKMYSFRC